MIERKKKFFPTIKIVLISLGVSLNVCVWRDVLGDTFDQAAFFTALFILGLFLRDKLFHDRGRWGR